MKRAAQVKVPLDVLRLLLDLPKHLRILEVKQSTEDGARGVCSLVVDGPYCPEWTAGTELPTLALHFRRVEPYGAELEKIVGLDT